MSGVACSHHVLSIKHLLCKLWDSEGAVLLTATRGEGGKSGHEEMQTGEGYLQHKSTCLSDIPNGAQGFGECTIFH